MTRGEEGHPIFLFSDAMPDGTYGAVLSVSADRSVVLDRRTGQAYALALLDAVQWAEYDAAIIRQHMEMLELSPETTAALIVMDVRPKRRPLLPTGQAISFVPGVSAETQLGFLTVLIDGEPARQWELSEARGHAHGVLEALLIAEYDGAYYRMLVDTLDIDEYRARKLVALVEDFRHREHGRDWWEHRDAPGAAE